MIATKVIKVLFLLGNVRLIFGSSIKVLVVLSGSGNCPSATYEFHNIKPNVVHKLNIAISSILNHDTTEFSVINLGDNLEFYIRHEPPASTVLYLSNDGIQEEVRCAKFLKAHIVVTSDDYVLALKSQRKFVGIITQYNEIEISYIATAKPEKIYN